MKKQLVAIHDDEGRAGTVLIAQGFNRRHEQIVRLVKKYREEFEKFNTLKVLNSRTKGRPFKEYLLDEDQFMFLGTLFKNNEQTVKFKARIIQEFKRCRKTLSALSTQKQTPEWIENRAIGKITRREETDTIKDFIIYAKEQGSTNAERYYTVLSNCVNSTMFDFNGKFKNKREAMTAMQLMDIKFADKIVSRGLIEGMSESLPYKEIYKIVKERLLTLAEIYGKSEVLSKQMLIE